MLRTSISGRTRQLFRVVAWNAALMLLLLLPIEILLRYRGPDVYRRSSPGMHAAKVAVWAEPDAELGWTLTRSPEWGRKGVPYRINRQGFRNSEDFDSLPAKTSSRRRLVVLGDSFAFGVGLQEHETLPAYLGQQLGPQWEIFNLGVPGYGIDQMVLSYEKYRSALQPDIVVLVFIDDDINRVFEAFRTAEGLPKPSFKLVQGSLIARQAEKENSFDRLLYRSRIANVFYARWYARRESIRISEAFLRRLAAATSRRRERLVVVRYPMLEHLEGKAVYPAYRFQDVLTPLGVTYVEPFDELRRTGDPHALYFVGHQHPTAEGNRRVAEVLRSYWPR